MSLSAIAPGLVRGCAGLAAALFLAACATTAPAAGPDRSPQARSPLAAPPASMMTPHGY